MMLEEQDDDLQRMVGNLVMVGFDGTAPSSTIRRLIEEYSVGAVLLTSKNLRSAQQTLDLILDLQRCALAAGHERPLLVAIDQENGDLNSLAEDSITQFPPAMAIAATNSLQLARQVALATGSELSSLGFNFILGPALDVLSSERAQPLGARAFGDEPRVVAAYGVEMVGGFRSAGLACCGKHFPSYGDVDFSRGVPFTGNFTLSQPVEELRQKSFIPFMAAMQDGLDAVYVGGCSLKGQGESIPHACLSETIVTKVLRHTLGFKGVTLSECLLIEGVFNEGGVGQRAVDAVKAGCDLTMICTMFQAQQNALVALRLAVSNGAIAKETVLAAANRLNALKDKYTSWQKALYPPGLSALRSLMLNHALLSTRAYRAAISLVRDYNHALNFLRTLNEHDEILLLTPLLEHFPSTATKMVTTHHNTGNLSGSPASSHVDLTAGEEIFQYFGSLLAQKHGSRVLHTSYSSNGLRPHHEKLIERCAAVIVITADASRNTYQYGVAKYANLLCKFHQTRSQTQPQQRQQMSNEQSRDETAATATQDQDQDQNLGQWQRSSSHGWALPMTRKPAIFVAVSSPWDFLLDQDIDTYVCTYDHSRPSLETLAEFLVNGNNNGGSINRSGNASASGSESTAVVGGIPPLLAVRRTKRRYGEESR